jgi:CO/xanthine dehydrogenase Mo-binding subunit
MAKVDGRAIVTGAHKYTYDMKRPGMLHAKVLYPQQFGATLISLDEAPTGYKDFDRGAAKKFVIDPHHVVAA